MEQEAVWQEIGKIVVTYPIMECDRCAITIMSWLRRQKIPGQILRLRTKRRSEMFIVSRRHGLDTSITENGIHYGVEVLLTVRSFFSKLEKLALFANGVRELFPIREV